jgi:hypothetical protein
MDIWGGIGRGIRDSSAAWSGACGSSASPSRISLSSPKPADQAGPSQSARMVFMFSSGVFMPPPLLGVYGTRSFKHARCRAPDT